MDSTPIYFIRSQKTFNTLAEAQDAKVELDQAYPNFPILEVGYFIPKQQYKSWVPSWLIRFITIK